MMNARSQAKVLHAIRSHWRAVALSTTSVDQERAAAAVAALYEAAVGRPPRHVLFFESPRQCELAGVFLRLQSLAHTAGGGPSPVLEALRRSMGGGGGKALREVSGLYRVVLEGPVQRELRELHWREPAAQELAAARAALERQLDGAASALVVSERPDAKDWLRGNSLTVGNAASLGHWMGWIANRAFTATAFPGARIEGSPELAEAVFAVCQECGWVWLYPDVAVVADRPQPAPRRCWPAARRARTCHRLPRRLRRACAPGPAGAWLDDRQSDAHHGAGHPDRAQRRGAACPDRAHGA
jgi:hypothetical protein